VYEKVGDMRQALKEGVRADQSAVGAVNRPLRPICFRSRLVDYLIIRAGEASCPERVVDEQGFV
jgi:hypothetical protein